MRTVAPRLTLLRLGLLLMVLASCARSPESRSEILLWLRTDLAHNAIERVTIRADFGAGRKPELVELDGKDVPGTIPIGLPEDGRKRRGKVHLRVEAETQALGRLITEVEASFAPQGGRLLEVALLASCAGVSCGNGETCGGSCDGCETDCDRCQPITREEQSLPILTDELAEQVNGDVNAPLAVCRKPPPDSAPAQPNDDPGQGGTDASSCPPAPCTGDKCVTSLALGANHTCAVTRGEFMVCWGSNQDGQLGREQGAGSAVYQEQAAVYGHWNWAMVGAGAWHTCGLKGDGQVFCWGGGAHHWNPYSVDWGRRFDDVYVAVSGAACGHDVDGHGWCWLPATEGFVWPVQVPVEAESPQSTQFVLGERGAYILTEDNRLLKWSFQDEPQEIARDVRSACTRSAICVLTLDGEVACMGDNGYGQAGPRGQTDDAHDLSVVQAGVQFETLAGSEKVTCALSKEGDVWCWGDNTHGVVGSAAGDAVGSPNLVLSADDCDPYVDVFVGNDSACVQRRSGYFDCWGGPDEHPYVPDRAGSILHRLVIH